VKKMSNEISQFAKNQEQYGNSDKLPPKFNAGLAKMMRIHELWRMCHMAKADLSDEKNIISWESFLFALKGEFIDRVEDEKVFIDCENQLRTCSNFREIVAALSNFELLLHKVEKQVGYSVPDKSNIFDNE